LLVGNEWPNEEALAGNDPKRDKYAALQCLKMKAVRSSQTSGICNSTTLRKNPDDLNPRQKHICASARLNLISLGSQQIHVFINNIHFNRRKICILCFD
jgi:hypothetical protein